MADDALKNADRAVQHPMKPFAWSYTPLRDWENCPRRYAHRYIQKEREPETEQMQWGTRVHKALDDRAQGRPLPDLMHQFEYLGEAIDQAKDAGCAIHNEQKLALTRELKPTAWFGPDVYVRAIIDLAVVGAASALVVDYKTGKKRDDETQLKLFAGFGFAHWPDVQVIETRYVWLQGFPPSVQEYKRTDLPWMWGELLRRAERMEKGVELKQFDPKPSGLCKWCSIKKCEFNRNTK